MYEQYWKCIFLPCMLLASSISSCSNLVPWMVLSFGLSTALVVEVTGGARVTALFPWEIDTNSLLTHLYSRTGLGPRRSSRAERRSGLASYLSHSRGAG